MYIYSYILRIISRVSPSIILNRNTFSVYIDRKFHTHRHTHTHKHKQSRHKNNKYSVFLLKKKLMIIIKEEYYSIELTLGIIIKKKFSFLKYIFEFLKI